MMMRRYIDSRPLSSASSDRLALDGREKRANWLTMRSSSDGGLEEQHEVAAEGVEVVEGGGGAVEHLGGENVGPFVFQDLAHPRRRQLIGLQVVDAPDGPVVIEFAEVFGGEVHGHVGRVAP